MEEFERFSKMARYNREVIVTEKIDGTNAQILIGEDGTILAGSRSRWLTMDDDNYGFCKWVNEHKDELLVLPPGRYYGEWYGFKIQRGYGLQNRCRRFALFNTSLVIIPKCCEFVPVLWRGNFVDMDISAIMSELKTYGSHAVPGYMNPEGIVIYHTAGNVSFKKTFDNDEKGKDYVHV